MYQRVGEKRRIDEIGIEDEEAIGSLCRLSGRPVSPKSAMEQEKRIRRQIANSNERRRMQSINAGFASLKTLLPHNEGEKLSKAAILQQTAEYIYQLEQEKTRLLTQNCHLKRLVNQHQHHAEAEGSPAGGDSPSEERCNNSPVTMTSNGTTEPTPIQSEDLNREIIELRHQLEQERRLRTRYEESLRNHEFNQFENVNEVKVESIEVDGIALEDENCKIIPMVTNVSSSKIKVDTRPKVQQYIPVLPSTSTKIITKPQQIQNNTNTAARQIHTSLSPATIVTVLPSNKDVSDRVPAVFDALSSKKHQSGGVKVEVEPLRVPSPATTIECVDDSSSGLKGTVYIVNSSNPSCQKSLDTICEAIRHLEGDHMFPVEEQHTPIEEEIITDDTFVTVEDPNYDHNQHLSHSGNLTLQMVPEPQEVPLELTTHRMENSNKNIISTIPHSSQSSNILQVSRPGVIVVKQT